MRANVNSLRGILLLLLLMLNLPGCSPRGSPEPVYVGHLAPLSGPDRALGDQARQAVQLSVSESLPEDKKGSRPIAVLQVDSRNDDETVRAEAVRLLTVNKVVALIGSLDGTLAERLVREGQSFGASVVVTGEIAGNMRPEGAITLGVNAGRRGQLLARLALEQKLTSVLVASDSRSSLAGELAISFVHETRKEKGVTVREQTFDGGAEKTAWLEDIIREKPSGVLLACSPGVFDRLSAALRKLSFKGALYYGGEDVGPGPLQQGAETELFLATVCCKEGLTPRGQEMARKFEATYHETPGYAAFQAYDACRLLMQAMPETNPTAATLKERLLKVETYESLMGPLVFKDHRTLRPVFLLQLKGRDSKLLRTVAPEKE
jgi:branched-chain amino acid transport system substrate-binding protein